MMLEKDFLVELIETKNPIEVIWNKLNEIWRFEELKELDNIEQLYIEKEKRSSKFEEILSKIFFEIYDELLENIMQKAFLKRIYRKNDEAIIIMDGFSIREANLALTLLKSKKYIVSDYFYSFSVLPSTTEAARMIFKQDFILVTKEEDVDRLSPIPEKIIWCTLPDVLLHSKQKGRIEILPLTDCLNRTIEILSSMIERIESDEIIITSDHGYLYFSEYETWWDISNNKIESILRKIFKSERFKNINKLSEKESKIVDELIKDGYISKNNEYIFVKGRYFWSAPGRLSPITHGGLSFMECLIPVIKLKRV